MEQEEAGRCYYKPKISTLYDNQICETGRVVGYTAGMEPYT